MGRAIRLQPQVQRPRMQVEEVVVEIVEVLEVALAFAAPPRWTGLYIQRFQSRARRGQFSGLDGERDMAERILRQRFAFHQRDPHTAQLEEFLARTRMLSIALS